MAGATLGQRWPRDARRVRAVASGLLFAILLVGSLFIVAPAGIVLLVAYSAPASSSPPVARASPSPGFSC